MVELKNVFSGNVSQEFLQTHPSLLFLRVCLFLLMEEDDGELRGVVQVDKKVS